VLALRTLFELMLQAIQNSYRGLSFSKIESPGYTSLLVEKYLRDV
jgi:hypothetical protein